MGLQDKIKKLPSQPGVYWMKDATGRILYIGKAKDLKKRVASYWSKAAGERYQIQFLLKKVVAVDCVVTDTEKEALLLEDTLIKKHKPPYNVDLKDNKSYLSIKLSLQDKFPRLCATRELKADGSRYFGPYTSAFAARQVIDFLERYFKLRTCSDRELNSRTRPCIEYQIGRCSAPCVDYVSKADYQEIVREVRLILEGRSDEIYAIVKTKMQAASEQEAYEEAAHYRDLLKDLETTLEQQKMVTHGAGDQDTIGLYREAERGVIAVLMIRAGKVCESRHFPFRDLAEDSELLDRFLIRFYRAENFIPSEIYLPMALESPMTMAEILAEAAGRRISLKAPQRGEKSELIKLATRNAREQFQRAGKREADLEEVLQNLQTALGLKRLPRRMECFDISNLQGKEAVGGVVSFCEGLPDKDHYRRFRIKTLPDEPNDYAMMHEVLSRRLHRSAGPDASKARQRVLSLTKPLVSLAEARPCQEVCSRHPLPNECKWELPDLIVVDGGKGQLAVAERVLKELDVLSVELCALAKAKEGEDRDKVFIPGRKNPILLPKNSAELHLLMRLRDEAHRFAISYHRVLSRKKLQSSVLDSIPGIGLRRKKTLLKHFGSLKVIRAATLEELTKAPQISRALAEKIYALLHNKSP